MCDSYLCSNITLEKLHLPRIGSRSISVRSPLVSRSSFASPSLHLRFLLATDPESSEEVADPEQRRKEDTTANKRGENGVFLLTRNG